MTSHDFSPNATQVGATFLYVSLVNISDTLAQIKIRRWLIIDTINLYEGGVSVRISSTTKNVKTKRQINKDSPFISQNSTFNV